MLLRLARRLRRPASEDRPSTALRPLPLSSSSTLRRLWHRAAFPSRSGRLPVIIDPVPAPSAVPLLLPPRRTATCLYSSHAAEREREEKEGEGEGERERKRPTCGTLMSDTQNREDG
uniref:Uncharacterized protein n=1 Tax=Oryza brachyantha TaxID=4533 RepID=J3NEF3_ORYBR